MVQLVKNPPAVLETWVRSLHWEDTLEKGKATHTNILTWRITWTCIVHGVPESDTTEQNFHIHTYIKCSHIAVNEVDHL